jgi:Uri superfamily endonuclease
MNVHEFPSNEGQYVLLLQLEDPTELRIGSLGTCRFDTGTFAYVGSAGGPGGLSARIERHLKPADQKRAHWHIDHLLAHATIRAVGWSLQAQRNECEWATSLGRAGRHWPRRFGASDCRCNGHLIEFAIPITFKRVIDALPEPVQIRQIRKST